MEPFSALSLASNVIQIVDVGTRVVSASFELYKSDGISVNDELENTMNDLIKICSCLERPEERVHGQMTSRSERDLIPLCLSCKKVGEELITVLKNLKVQSPHKKWQSFRQALRAVWKEKDIHYYQERIKSLRSEIAFHLIAILRYTPTLLFR